ncbi:hypothetical protein ABPG75_010479 [Micractinium tetrahymenae]
MSVDAEIVRARLRSLLPDVDMETATQRSITQKLEEELGAPLSAHKPLIKEEIDIFLTQQPPSEDAEFGDEAAAAPPAAKRMRGGAGAAAPAPGALPAALAGSFAVALSARRFASVRHFGTRWMVDVREFYQQGDALQPSKHGLSLQAPAWAALEGQAAALSQAFEQRDDSFYVDLGGNKRASVSSYKGRCSVDLREYYEKDGEMLPGKKGVALSGEEWDQLCAAVGQLSQQLAAASGGAGSGGGGAAAPAKAAGGAAAATGAGPASGGAAGGGAVVAAAAAGGLPLELSASRRADISHFKGQTFVGIREYYEKDGQQLPGKKGISLSPDQFSALRQRVDDVDAALRRRDTTFELQLSNKRKATINCFKGRHMVDLREYYEKDGKAMPGSKGISLPEEQWTRLMSGLPALAAALAPQ